MVKPKKKIDSEQVLSNELGGGRSEALYGDALTDATRKIRRSLLALSVAGVLISVTHALPSGITSLGISLSDASREVILYGLIAVIFYYGLTFVVHALADVAAWRLKYESARVNEFTEWLNTEEGRKTRGDDSLAGGPLDAATGKIDHMAVLTEATNELRQKWNASTDRFIRNSKLVTARTALELLFPIALALAAEFLLLRFVMSL